MKRGTIIRFIPLMLVGISLVLSNSCKKDIEYAIYDVDGNGYNTITIGTQVWMIENLKTTKYSNGDLIVTTTPATLDIRTEITPKYQWAYDGNENNVATYGRLYTWYAVTDSRNVCPTGWHVPSYDEWLTLNITAGGGDVGGGNLKETGTDHWISPNTGATNGTGFTALPSGFRYNDGTFYWIGYHSYWWSATEYNSTIAWEPFIINSDSYLGFCFSDVKESGCSVRCIKDSK
jgi:uncharacterized protein (TIGR02145 family)